MEDTTEHLVKDGTVQKKELNNIEKSKQFFAEQEMLVLEQNSNRSVPFLVLDKTITTPNSLVPYPCDISYLLCTIKNLYDFYVCSIQLSKSSETSNSCKYLLAATFTNCHKLHA